MDPVWIERASEYAADIVEMWGGAEQIRSYPLAEPLVFSRLRSHRSEWENNRYHKDFGEPRGLNDALLLFSPANSTTIGSCGFGRHDLAGQIGDLEVEAASLLIPHLRRAVAISRLLDAKSIATSTFESTLDAFAVGVVLTDAGLGIVHANAAARAMLSAHGPIRSERGALAVRPSAMLAALGAAVRQAAEDEAEMGRRGLGIPAARADGAPCVLHILPLRHGALRPGLAPRAAAAIFVAPACSRPPAPVDALAALFDLTAAEARVFGQIAAGLTMREAAEALGIEGTTVRRIWRTSSPRPAPTAKPTSSR